MGKIEEQLSFNFAKIENTTITIPNITTACANNTINVFPYSNTVCSPAYGTPQYVIYTINYTSNNVTSSNTDTINNIDGISPEQCYKIFCDTQRDKPAAQALTKNQLSAARTMWTERLREINQLSITKEIHQVVVDDYDY